MTEQHSDMFKKMVIDSGALVLYYPLKFENILDIKGFYENIEKLPIVVSKQWEEDGYTHLDIKDNYRKIIQEKEQNTIIKGIPKTIEAVENYNKTKDESRIKDIPDTSNYDANSVLAKYDVMTHLAISLPAASIQTDYVIESKSKRCIINTINELVDKKNTTRIVYGMQEEAFSRTFVLPPVYIIDNNDEHLLSPVELTLYKEGSGMLKIKIPLVTYSVAPLLTCQSDLSFKGAMISNIFNSNCADFVFEFNALGDIPKAFVDYISQRTGLKYTKDACFSNIIFSDFDGQPSNFNSMKKTTSELIFRILSSPIAYEANLEREAYSYLESHSWGNADVRYFFGSAGSCVSMLTSGAEKKYGVPEEDKLSFLIKTCDSNVDYAIRICLLKRLNIQMLFRNTTSANYKQFHEIHKAYTETDIMIAEMQSNCFGTVSEQIAKMFESMPHYFRSELLNSIIEKRHAIVAQHGDKIKEKQSKAFSIASILVAFIFGLSAIYDTVYLIRGLFTFGDVPYISVANLSVTLWIVMVLCLVFYFYKKQKSDE